MSDIRPGFVPEEFLGQIQVDGKWVDFARGTEKASSDWVEAGRWVGDLRRVVDWIDKDKVIFTNEGRLRT